MLAPTSPEAASPARSSSRRSFLMGSITAEWTRSVARKRETFGCPCAGYREKGGCYPRQQDSSAQRCHVACCRGADGRGYPLQGSTRSNNNKNNNNNNNHTTLAERFQPSTRDELQQLDLYTNTDTPDTAHQLDAEAIAAKIRSYPENLRGYGPPPGGTLESSIGQKDSESGQARRLRTGIVSLSHRGTEGYWHQVGVQN